MQIRKSYWRNFTPEVYNEALDRLKIFRIRKNDVLLPEYLMLPALSICRLGVLDEKLVFKADES